MPGVVVEPIDGMFLLLEGAAEAVKTYWFDREGKVVCDYRVGKDRMGDYFGEGVFLGAEDRAATIRAVGHTRVIHLDSKAFARMRAGKVDKMLNEHYLRQLESEHKVLASMKRVEECSELYTAIEDFALNNDVPMPKLATTEELGGFKVAGTTAKAVVKMKRRARRASVERMDTDLKVENFDEIEDEDARMLREMRESEASREESPKAKAEREKIAKSLAENKRRGRRASVDLVAIDVLDSANQTKAEDTEKKGRYRGRRRSVSEWEAAGGDAIDPSSPATTPVDSPTMADKKKPHRSRTHSHLSSASSMHQAKDDGLRRTRSHSSRHTEKDGDGKSRPKHKSSDSASSPKPRRRRASVQE